MIQLNNYSNIDSKLLKALSFNINGKRAYIQKQAKQMLINLKKRLGQESIQQLIEKSADLEEE